MHYNNSYNNIIVLNTLPTSDGLTRHPEVYPDASHELTRHPDNCCFVISWGLAPKPHICSWLLRRLCSSRRDSKSSVYCGSSLKIRPWKTSPKYFHPMISLPIRPLQLKL